MTDLKQEIIDKTDKLNCEWESGEKEALKGLGGQLETIKDQKDILKPNINILGDQILPEKNKTLKDFFEQDIKAKLESKKAERDQKAEGSKDFNSVNAFVKEVGEELQTLCGNKSDIVMALQIYVNGLNDMNGQHATIPYSAKKYGYEADTKNRLFIDGFLGPHTYNALWLALFKEEIQKIDLIRKPGFTFDRNEPRIIGKDQPYLPLTLPGLDESGNAINGKSIEIIDDEKIKGAIELLYLFYDGVSKKEKISVDIDEEIIKIMTNPDLYNDDPNAVNHFDGYLTAIKGLIIDIAGENKDLEKGRNAITKFINTNNKQEESEYEILETLEYDIGVHEYVADYIANKRNSLDINKVNSLINNEYREDKDYKSFKGKIDKQRKEQKNAQKSEFLTIFVNMKKEANKSNATQEDKDSFLQIFGVDANAENADTKINDKITETLNESEKYFMDEMNSKYIQKAELEKKISGDTANIDDFGHYNGTNKELALFADIQGIGTFDMSSENRETTKFIAQMVAEEAACFAVGALTAGAGGVALKAALYGRRALKIARVAKAIERGVETGRMVSRFNKVKNIVKTVNLAEKMVKAERSIKWTGKAINALSTTLGVATEGVAFYQATNAMQNIFNGKPTFEGRDNIPENMKSIAMMGALRIVNKLVAAEKLVTLGGKEFNVNPFNKLSVKSTDKIFTKVAKVGGESLVGGGAIFAVEGIGEMNIDTDHDWTKEEFIQSVLMYMIFRGAGEVGKLRITKNKKTGKPEIQKPNPDYKPEKPKIKAEPKKKSAEYNGLKADKRLYLEKQKEINGKIKEIKGSKNYKEKISNDVQKIKENSKGTREEVAALERRLTNHKEQIKNLEDPAYKAKNGGHISEVEAKKFIEGAKNDITILEKNLAPKKKILDGFDNQIKLLERKIQLINNKQITIKKDIGILEKRINNYKEQIKNLEDPAYKAKNGGYISEVEAKKFIEGAKNDIAGLEKQIQNKQSELLKIEQEFANGDIKNLRLDRLEQAKHIDNINVILKNEIISSAKNGKTFSTKVEAESFLKSNSSLLKKGTIIALIVGGSLLVYKTAKGTENENIIEEISNLENPVEQFNDIVTVDANNNFEFVPVPDDIEK